MWRRPAGEVPVGKARASGVFPTRNSDRSGGGRPRQSGQRNRFSQDRRGGDYRGKSGGARQNRDRDSDRNGPTAKSPWQKNKPTFEKKPAKTFRKAKGKKTKAITEYSNEVHR